jgi:signal transduction histidine kinase
LIDIMDKGPGIPKSDRRKVFDMFYSARPGGTGLGLFLAKTAIERSRGRITVRDRPGGGAWFRIALPLASEPRPGAGQAAWVEFCAEFRGFCSGLREGR